MSKQKARLANGMEDSPRGRLLAAAAHLFRIRGFERTTVRDLAQEVGIQSGSIFHHFKTKEEILRCVMEEVIHFNTQRLQRSIEQVEGCEQRLFQLIKSELISISGDTGEAMAVLIFEWRCLKPESQKAILELRAQYDQIWLVELEKAQQKGLISKQRDLSILRRLLSGATAWSNYWYKSGGEMDVDALARQTLYMIVNPKQ